MEDVRITVDRSSQVRPFIWAHSFQDKIMQTLIRYHQWTEKSEWELCCKADPNISESVDLLLTSSFLRIKQLWYTHQLKPSNHDIETLPTWAWMILQGEVTAVQNLWIVVGCLYCIIWVWARQILCPLTEVRPLRLGRELRGCGECPDLGQRNRLAATNTLNSTIPFCRREAIDPRI